VSADRQGWFADIDPEQAASEWPWQPCLQLDGGTCHSFETWFRTKQECVDYILSEIIGQGLIDDTDYSRPADPVGEDPECE
jgi:hypothetical protein